ncbi:SDR family NAD(P)-dependent oxidoreductase [Streptomyces sp. NPDC088097]|uniref:SDR family NAD(P)-dependent oxidoreductase n=1 Tax=Streptomyces sp. NPDC088097 TaxID=3365823 RepID=UPI00382D06B1
MSRTTRTRRAAEEPVDAVAVVGAACRLPGGIDSPAALWRLLEGQQEAVGPVPGDRWDAPAVAQGLAGVLGRQILNGGYLPARFFRFDPAFFGISGHEARWMDPQHKLLLMVAWEAFEHAGIPLESLRGSGAGVFSGMFTMDHLLRGHRRAEEVSPYWTTGGMHGVGVGRLSFFLDLHGPCMAVDTSCSSSLVALHLACQSLQARECPLALVGGASAGLGPEVSVAEARWEMLSPTGHIRAFDAEADGFVRSEGCVVMVLKLLSDAKRDGDRILGVVRGTAVNQDGRSVRLTAPSSDAQAAVFSAALRRAGLDAGQVGMIEAHGTGTAIGDPLEFAALKKVYGAGSGRCALGSVKTNLGHTEPASGLVGLLKVLLSLQHATVPATLHFRRWNPQIDAGDCRLFVPTHATPWPVESGPRLAAVSSYGVSGINAHAVVEQGPVEQHRRGRRQPQNKTFLLSAGSAEALRESTARLGAWLEADGQQVPLADLAHTLAVRRSHGRHRAAVVAHDRKTLAARLDAYARGGDTEGVTAGRVLPPGPGPVFVYSGHGSQWARMGRRLLGTNRAFTKAMDELEAVIQEEGGFSVRQMLDAKDLTTATERIQPVLFALQVALTAMWRSHGIEPAAVIGHSMGEIAAAVACGALTVQDGARVVCRRAKLLTRVMGQGAMAAVQASAEEVERDLRDGDQTGVEIAVLASPSSTVVAGDDTAIDRLLERWLARDIAASKVAVNYASHSSHMDPLIPLIRDALADVRPAPPGCTFYTTVLQDPRAAATLDAGYWADNLRRPVRFASAVAAAASDGHRHFIEISPHPLLTAAISATLEQDLPGQTVALPTLHHDQDERLGFATALAALHCAGSLVPWRRWYARGTLCEAPATTWETGEHLIDPSMLTTPASAQPHPLLGTPFSDPADAHRHLWHHSLPASLTGWLRDHSMAGVAVMPGAGFCEMALAAAEDALPPGEGVVHLRDITFDTYLPLDAEPLTTLCSASYSPYRSSARWQASSRRDAQTILHSTATLSRVANPPRPPHLEVSELEERYPRLVPAGALYKRWQHTLRLEYGPAFRPLAWVRLSEDDSSTSTQAVARLHLPDEARPHGGSFRCHPTLLDGALQTLLALWTLRADLPPGSAYPVGIGELHLLGDARRAAFCRARAEAVSLSRITGALELLDEEGLPLLSVDGIRFAHEARAADPDEERLYQHRFEQVSAPTARQSAEPWLILLEQGPGSWESALLDALRAAGARLTLIEEPLTTAPDGFRQRLRRALDAADEPFDNVLQLTPPPTGDGPGLWSAQTACARTTRLTLLARTLVEAAATPPRLQVLTHHGQPVVDGEDVALESAGLRGLLRSLAYEHPELHARLIDTDISTKPELIGTELLAEPDDNDEVIWRTGHRYAARLAPAPLRPDERRSLSLSPGDHAVTAEPAAVPGHLTYTLDPDSSTVDSHGDNGGSPPADAKHDVRIAVTHTCLGDAGVQLPVRACAGRTLPDEGSHDTGRCLAVLTPAPGLVSPITVDPRWTTTVPDHLDPGRFAGSLLPYLTARHILHDLARLAPRQRVLLHGPRTATLLAALHIAHAAGALVHVDADEDRDPMSALPDHVRSHDPQAALSYDVVLDTTTHPHPDALPPLNPGARWITLTVPGPRPDTPGTLTAHCNPAAVLATPGQAEEHLRETGRALAEGTWPLLPVRRLPLDDLTAPVTPLPGPNTTAAYAWPRAPITAYIPPTSLRLVHDDGSYIITGGLGGLGMILCRWLSERGAGRIILNSRSAPDPETLTEIHSLRENGAHIEVLSADLAEPETAERLVNLATQTGLPLRGVIHAAAVVADATVTRTDPKLIDRVWRPKAAGAWLLHEATVSQPVDWWVGFSSFVSQIGSPGQGPYASASAWLDALIAHRHAHGLPALGINWGPWGERGIGARTIGARGFATIAPVQALRVLERLLAHARPTTGCIDLDVTAWLQPYPDVAASAYLSPLMGDASTPDQPAEPRDQQRFLAELRDIKDATARTRLLTDHIRNLTADVLRAAPDRIDIHASLVTLGMDSLHTIRLRQRLRTSLDIDIPVTAMYKAPSVQALTAYIDEHLT